MCANTGHSPDGRVSFSCRIAASLRKLPQDERPNLQEVLREYGRKANEINPAWFEQVGGDFAAGARGKWRKEMTVQDIAKRPAALSLRSCSSNSVRRWRSAWCAVLRSAII